MSCTKKTYRTRQEAKNSLRLLNKTKHHGLTDVYYCDACSAYHLTSLNKRDSRRLKKRQ